MNNVVKAIKSLRPNVPFTFGKNEQEIQVLEPEYLMWIDDNSTPPTVEEIYAEIARQEQQEYKELRATEYPSIGDQLDALFHAGVFPEEMAAQIQAIKDKYPKGQ